MKRKEGTAPEDWSEIQDLNQAHRALSVTYREMQKHYLGKKIWAYMFLILLSLILIYEISSKDDESFSDTFVLNCPESAKCVVSDKLEYAKFRGKTDYYVIFRGEE